jgi:hypothetical protein
MPRFFTGEEILAVIRKNCGITNVDSEGTSDDDLLKYVNEESYSLYSELMIAKSEYLVVTELAPLIPANSRYRLNHRCLFQKLRDVVYLDENSGRFSLEPIARENIPFSSYISNVNRPTSYYPEGNHLVMWPPMTSGAIGSLEISFYFRPGELVLSADCRRVSMVNTASGLVTLDDTLFSEWTTSESYDIHSAFSGSEIHAWDITPSAVGSNTLTFAPGDINGTTAGRYPVEVGDWVCLTETAAVPGMPRELHPILAQMAICRIKESRDPEALAASKSELNGMLEMVRRILAIRIEGHPQKVSLQESTFFGR